ASANAGAVHFRYLYNSDGATGGDDWLYSPCISLDATKAYKLSFWEEVGEDGNGLYPEKLEVKMGTANSSTGMTENVLDFGALSVSSYEEQKAAFKPNATSSYYLGFHCYSDADAWFLDVDDVHITELLKPTAAFTTAPNGSSVNVTDGSTDMITTWDWNWGDGTTSQGQIAGPHTYTGTGTRTICLIVTNLAGADTVCHDITITGLEQVDISENISVYPNPTNKILNVNLNGTLKGEAKIEITNILGETLLSRTTQTSVERFDMSKLAQGVYYVRITANEIKAVRKFVYTK
ncbi:MAG: T9SS type A sorting domain-containing protein, partial [Bacteroidetes bacterium]|nr:T9SS type A sorting domain-containing protein [Bacteroidota bacterium]